MGKSRYIKDEKGVTMSVATSTLGLEKPLLNENYNIDVHNRNMDKIDEDLTPIDDSYIIELFQHDGDISRPKDYYTKEESDLKYATKEEVQDNTNLANQALNKANEAFQRGDNVKTQLVDKLISEGLDVSTNNSFEELIENISLGKKWAKGTSDTFLNNSIANYYVFSIDLNNLGFVPNTVIATTTWNTLYIPMVLYSNELKDIPAGKTLCCQFVNNENSSNSGFISMYDCIIKENIMYLMGNNSGRTYNWIAFE
jgi:hypothetical protein|nr:MAG TPA: hypothetical protein [Caudoviricetes sp.]